ncbi:MAG: Gfo/Idh/MocA family oxidoreductase [Prolixibacteraceae bacterium]|jgi:predicted dehydrogenase|nr:Gfo/Idh/MocA family oxidoreductase [Prolixibacteraceae bacterium]
MKDVKWGIIGCGDVTEVKSGPAFSKAPHSELVAVMRRDASKAADYAKRHSVKKWYSEAQKLIEDSEVNAIYVATPPSSHAFYAKMAIQAGKPVYIEKPMCRTYAECIEVNELAEKHEVPVFVAYYRRKLSGFLKVKSLIEQGAIGEVRTLSLQLFKHAEEDLSSLPWRVDPSVAGGGHFYDLASHQLDYLDYVFGPINEVYSVVENQGGLYPAEDIISASFSFKSGVIGNGNWCFNASAVNDRDVMEIIGTKGRIEFSCFDFTPVKLVKQDGTQYFEYSKPSHVQQSMIEHVVAVLCNEEEAVSSGKTGARTNKVMEEIVNRYYKTKK